MVGKPTSLGSFIVFFLDDIGAASDEPIGSVKGDYEGYTIIDFYGHKFNLIFEI